MRFPDLILYAVMLGLFGLIFFLADLLPVSWLRRQIGLPYEERFSPLALLWFVLVVCGLLASIVCGIVGIWSAL